MNNKSKPVTQAIVLLKKDIEATKAQLAALAPLAAMAKAMEPPAPVKEAHAILSAIPEETKKALKIVSLGFDPKVVWFQLVRENGLRISVKKQENDFRVRDRDQSGALLKEATPSFNGLSSALAALA
jgi:hypothetical protein